MCCRCCQILYILLMRFVFSLSLSPVSFFFLTSCIFSRQQRQQRQHGVMTPSERQHLRQQNLRRWQQKSCIRYAKWRYNAICSVLPVKEQAATLQRQHFIKKNARVFSHAFFSSIFFVSCFMVQL